MKISLTIILSFLGMLSLHAQNISDAALFSQLKEGEKGAVVAVHIGTDDASVSAHTIDVFNEQLQKEFPQQAFFSVVTSNASLSRQLTELAKDGFTHLLIQPSFIVDDVEMTVSSEEDCQTIVKAISQKYGGKNANLLLGEGSSYMTQAFNSPYTFIQYAISSPSMLKTLKGDWYVATLNGYPTLQNAIERMQANKEKKVNIITLHFSPSSTIQNEVAETMKSQILPAGFKATATHQSLGELPEVIDVFMEHARYAATHRSLSPIEEKFSHSYHY